MRAVAAVAVLIGEAQKITTGYLLTVKVPHEVNALLADKAAMFLMPARHTAYEAVITSNPEVTVKVCCTLNPATLLPNLEKSGEREHSCKEVIEEDLPLRPDLTDEKIENADIELYTDGSSYMIGGKCYTGYAVVTLYETVKVGALSPSFSAQTAELIALMEAMKIAKGCVCSIFTDCRYAFNICHATGKLWRERGFITVLGKE